MIAMAEKLEVEVAHIHIAGGAPRITPPPGALAEVAPRRAARGRADDVLFISLGLTMPEPASPGLADHLARMASDAYFGTPGSVTAALREAAMEVNAHLQDLARDQSKPRVAQGRMIAAVLRGNSVFVAQCGNGQVILVRPGQVSRFTSEEAAGRPLGLTLSAFVRYHHFEVGPQDLLILTTWSPPLWADTTLSGLSGLDAARAVDRLSAASTDDRYGMLIRLSAAGEQEDIPTLEPAEAQVSPPPKAEVPQEPEPVRQERWSLRRKPRLARPKPAASAPSSGPSALSRTLDSVGHTARSAWTKIVEAVAALVTRMAPGLREPPKAGSFAPSLLAGTAIAIPLIVAAITSIVYLRQARPELASEYVFNALEAVASAQIQPDGESARPYWHEALEWLDKAENYGVTEETNALRQTAQQALDALDFVTRLDFNPTIQEGFHPGAQIDDIAATSSGVYALDRDNLSIWFAWTIGRGYQLDNEFDCLDGPDSIPGMGAPVDIAIYEESGLMGAESLVAIDSDGTVLICAQSEDPRTVQLTPPDTGMGHIQAMDVLFDSLYVLAPDRSMVWIFRSFDTPGGDTWEYYFADSARDLRNAIDIVMTNEGLIVLYADGYLDICYRSQESLDGGGISIDVSCREGLSFQDPRSSGDPSEQMEGFVPDQMVFSSSMESSLYLLDSDAGSVLRYSMGMVFLDHFRPSDPLPLAPTALALAPPYDMFLAAGNQVYVAETLR
jgi:hypothetical protein